jgi:8-oxo-dGTP pyrophosphatase MutT (NUDIX family)
VPPPASRGGEQRIPRPSDARPGRPAPWSDLSGGGRRLDVGSVRRALAEGPPPQRTPAERPDVPTAGLRASAVLAPLYDDDGEAVVILTRRAQHMRSHRGEVSFPGGGQEPGETLWATAVREAWEEISLDPSSVDPIGELDHLSTRSSGSFIAPFVGALRDRPDRLVADPSEVEHILHVPLSELVAPGVYREEIWRWESVERPIFFFEVVGDTIWGATAAMLRNLLCVTLGLPPDPRSPL